MTQELADIGTVTPGSRAGSRPMRWARSNWVPLLLVLISLLYGGTITVLHDDTASPIDELVYIDYTHKTYSQGMVFEGERFGPDVTQVVACEGVFPFGTLGQECGSTSIEYDSLPNGGLTTGAPYTPVYFWITRIVGDAIQFVSGLSAVTSWRLTGPIWLALGMFLFSRLLATWRVSKSTTFTMGLLFIASPFAWWSFTYLSTDVTAFVFGAAMLLLATGVARRERSPWWFVPLVFVAALFKITNLLILGLVLIFFIMHSIAKSARRRRFATVDGLARSQFSLWGALSVSVIVGALVQVVWTRLLPILAVSEARADQGVSRELRGMDILTLLGMSPAAAITHNPVAGINGGQLLTAAYQPLAWVAIASVFGALMSIRWSTDRGPIIWATAIASIVALPALGIAFYVMTGSYFDLPGRYAGSLIPAVLLLGGFLLKSRAAQVVLWCYSGLLMLVAAVTSIFIRQMF